MSRVFTTELIKATDIEQRVSVMEAMIKIATRCKELHNYGTIMQILLTLYSSPVARMKTTWSVRSPDMNEILSNQMIHFRECHPSFCSNWKR